MSDSIQFTADDSILDTIRRSILGDEEVNGEESAYDYNLMLQINSCFVELRQIGIGSNRIFQITGDSETWGDFLSDLSEIYMVKNWMVLKIRSVFDPPASSAVASALDREIAQLTWRLNMIHEVDWDALD